MVNARFTVRCRWTLEEGEQIILRPGVDGLPEDIFLFPERLNSFFEFRKIDWIFYIFERQRTSSGYESCLSSICDP